MRDDSRFPPALLVVGVLLAVVIALVAQPGLAAAEPPPATLPVASLDALLGVQPDREAALADWLAAPVPGRDGVSLGTTSTGTLHDGLALPLDGEHLAVVATHHDREARYAAANLHALLEDAAAVVAETHPGTRVMLGDASSADGGDLRGHGSHNCGRDVDILLFWRRVEDDEPLEPDRFRRFDDELQCCDGRYVFDLARNWTLVEALLRSEQAQVQYIFIYDPLRRALLEHARAQGVAPELIERARSILRQPSDSSRHADHFHVRVFCSPGDRLEGCANRGPRWSWADLHDDVVHARVTRLARVVRRDPARAPRALARLGATLPRAATVELAPLLVAADRALRDQAWSTLRELPVDATSYPALAAVVGTTSDPAAQRRALALIGRAGTIESLALLHDVATRGDGRTALAATQAVSRIHATASVPVLVALLAHDEASVREEARATLRRRTNFSGPADTVAWEEQRGWWEAWWQRHRHEQLDDWLVAGFNDAGIEMEGAEDPAAIEALIVAQTEQPPWVADNAHRMLMRTVGYWFSPSTPPSERRDRWERWWARNEWRYEAPSGGQ